MLNFKYLTSKAITVGLTLFWLVFWLFNGLDKFLNRTDLGSFTWFGKDRGWQFGVYLENIGVPLDFVPAILNFAGLWEIGVAFIFAFALNIMLIAGQRDHEHSDKVHKVGLFFSMLTFIAFCAFDVIVGDRAELLEHSTYIIVIAVSFISVAVENLIMAQRASPAPAPEAAEAVQEETQTFSVYGESRAKPTVVPAANQGAAQ